jgi:tetratricopeptide (TPR) repeat protein
MAVTNKRLQKAVAPPAPVSETGFRGSVNRAEEIYQRNSNLINVIGIVILVVVAGIFAYSKLYKAPRENKAQEMVFMAQHYFDKDSLNLALNGDGNNYGFLRVIDRYGDTRVGQTAKYCAGVIYIRMGQFQKGIDFLKQFDARDKIIQAEAYGLMGDAYMELGRTADGIAYYKKAGNYNDNDLISPLYLLREGIALEKAGKPSEAIAVYKQIKSKYPQSLQGREIDKFLARLGDFE